MRRLLALCLVGMTLSASASVAFPVSAAPTPSAAATPTATAAATATASTSATLAPTATVQQPYPTFPPEPPTDPETSVRVGAGPFAFHVDLGEWIGKLLRGFGKAIGVDAIESFGGEIAGWLLTNPDLTHNAGQMGNVQRVTDALRLAALSVVVVLFIVAVYRFWLGGERAPTVALGRLLAALVVLGFYRPLVGLLVETSNAVTKGVLNAGANATPPAFGQILAAIPTSNPLWSLAGVIALVFLFVLGVVRVLGYASLLVAYVMGPILVPLGLLPETAGYTALWAKHGLKLLFWSVLWAVEFRLFDALKEGLYLADSSVGHALLAPFAALAMLVVMFKTPMMLHSGSFEQQAQTVVRVVRMASATMGTAFTGGAAAGAGGVASIASARSRGAVATSPMPTNQTQAAPKTAPVASNSMTTSLVQTVRLPLQRREGE